MIGDKKIIVVLPAYNAEKTLEKTFRDIPADLVDEVILTDDFSTDNTVEIARKIGIVHIVEHQKNRGYGGNQKSCYQKAIELGADIVIMLHPDYQYNPKLIPAMSSLIATGVYDVVLGSRILGNGALKGGMPIYKYIFNRMLTAAQNILMGQKLSEYHTGYRAYSKEVLGAIPFENNSDDFVFDNEIIAQIFYKKFTVGEISCPAKYEKDSSSINFARSMKYGIGVLGVSFKYFFQRLGIKSNLFSND